MNETTTLDLRAGDVIDVPATLNSRAYRGTVASVEPWLLTAGPRAGKQATSGRAGSGELLYTVAVVDVTAYGDCLSSRYTDDLGDLPTRRLARTASDTFAVQA